MKNSKIRLSNGMVADPHFLNVIKVGVEERITFLPCDKGLTLKVICGEFWKNLTVGEKVSAGHCMVHLVKTGILPFRIVPSVHEYPVRYQLK